jgi:hypothetical protein
VGGIGEPAAGGVVTEVLGSTPGGSAAGSGLAAALDRRDTGLRSSARRRYWSTGMKVLVPALQRLPPGETFRTFTVTPTHLGFEEYNLATQCSVSPH